MCIIFSLSSSSVLVSKHRLEYLQQIKVFMKFKEITDTKLWDIAESQIPISN